MKKITFVLGVSAALLLGACGSEEADKGPEQESASPKDKTIETTEQSETAKNEEASSEIDSEENVEESAEQEEDIYNDEALELIEGIAHPIKVYDAQDAGPVDKYGMNIFDFEGFKLGLSVFLVDFKPFEEYLYDFEGKENIRSLLVLTDAENTNDFDVDYNGDMTFVTDTKEQVSGDNGVLSSNTAVQTYFGQVEGAGYYIIPLKDDSEPAKLTAILGGPWKVVDGAVSTENGPMGGEKRISYIAIEE